MTPPTACPNTPSGQCIRPCETPQQCRDTVSPFRRSGRVSDFIQKSNHPSGLDCSVITGHMGFNLGTAVECLWRSDGQADPFPLLQMAKAYIDREIQKREGK